MKKTLVPILISLSVWLIFIATLGPLFLIYLLVWIFIFPFDIRGKKHIVVRILDAIKPEDYDFLPLPMLMKKTEKFMADELNRLRNENILLHHE